TKTRGDHARPPPSAAHRAYRSARLVSRTRAVAQPVLTRHPRPDNSGCRWWRRRTHRMSPVSPCYNFGVGEAERGARGVARGVELSAHAGHAHAVAPSHKLGVALAVSAVILAIEVA